MAPEPRPPAELERFRRELRQLDRELLALYARRRRAVRDLWEYKRREGLPLRDPPQEDRVLRQAREVAGEEGIPPADAEAFMRWLLLACRRAAQSSSRWGGQVGEDRRDGGSPARRVPLSGRDPARFLEGSYAAGASDGRAGRRFGRKPPSSPVGTGP